MLTLYELELSPFSDKVRRILQFKGIPFRSEAWPINDYARRKKLHHAAKLPVISHDGRTIGDSTQIALYLEQRFPEPALLPSDAAERALCLMLEDWADESLYFYEMRLRLHLESNAPTFIGKLLSGQGRLARRLSGPLLRRAVGMTLHFQGMGRRDLVTFLEDVERQICSVADRVNGCSWLVGEHLSLADISVWAMMKCILETPEGQELAAPRPELAAWMARVDEKTQTRS